MSNVIMLTDDGFEEVEAITVVDILRRAGIECDICAVNNKDHLEGAHKIVIKPDNKLSDFEIINEAPAKLCEMYGAVYLPGGPGANSLRDNKGVIDIIKAFNEKGKLIAAICGAPKVLERAGLLNGGRVTSYPDIFEDETALNNTGNFVEHDGNIITGKAAGAAADFAFEIVKTLKDGDTADKVKAAMFYR